MSKQACQCSARWPWPSSARLRDRHHLGYLRLCCLPVWASALVAFAVGYTVRVLALYYAWEEPLASEPKGVYLHNDGRPMLGRKLKGKSQREMAMLGLSMKSAPSTSQPQGT